ncbi:MAG TPA: hypothetical protein V6D11_09575, partial [Waterburya sp.]
MHGYMDQVMQLTTEDAKVRFVLLEVLNMLKPPTALFRPSILIQVLREMFRSTFGLQPRALHGELNRFLLLMIFVVAFHPTREWVWSIQN